MVMGESTENIHYFDRSIIRRQKAFETISKLVKCRELTFLLLTSLSNSLAQQLARSGLTGEEEREKGRERETHRLAGTQVGSVIVA